MALDVRPLTDRLVEVRTPNGCPFLTREISGQAACSIYEARPFQCRRFMCLRPDPTTEPFEVGGPLGCRNLSDRLDDSQHAMTFYQSHQRRAQKWARTMGWSKEMTA